jgi:hypothetical protein
MAAGKKGKEPEERTDASGRVLNPWEVDPADQLTRGGSTTAPVDADGDDPPNLGSEAGNSGSDQGEQASV